MNSKSNSNSHSQILDFAEANEYQEGQSVQLVIKNETDLGYKAIINEKHWGVIYRDEVFQILEKNQTITGYIKKIREDGRIDLSLTKTGYQATDDIENKILDLLKKSETGFLPISDKTTPETIYEMFSVSKKKYKMALGGLYKKRLISVEEKGIRLVTK